VNRFTVFQGHDAQNPAAQLPHATPMPYPAVRLNLLLERVADDPRAPLALDVWALAQNLFLEVTGRLHGSGDYHRSKLPKAKGTGGKSRRQEGGRTGTSDGRRTGVRSQKPEETVDGPILPVTPPRGWRRRARPWHVCERQRSRPPATPPCGTTLGHRIIRRHQEGMGGPPTTRLALVQIDS
jgi:hypothetical protein